MIEFAAVNVTALTLAAVEPDKIPPCSSIGLVNAYVLTSKVPKTTTLLALAKALTLYKFSLPAVTVAIPVNMFAP